MVAPRVLDGRSRVGLKADESVENNEAVEV